MHCGLLSGEELQSCVATAFNPVRVGVRGRAPDIWVRDVLNMGVCPRALLALLRAKFLAEGGTLLEHTAFRSARVLDDGVELALAPAAGSAPEAGDVNRPSALRAPLAAGAAAAAAAASPSSSSSAAAAPSRRRALTARLMVDAMGHYSPVVKQMRGGRRPDGVVLVVGGAFEGVPPEANTSGDLLYSLADASDDMQLFWEVREWTAAWEGGEGAGGQRCGCVAGTGRASTRLLPPAPITLPPTHAPHTRSLAGLPCRPRPAHRLCVRLHRRRTAAPLLHPPAAHLLRAAACLPGETPCASLLGKRCLPPCACPRTRPAHRLAPRPACPLHPPPPSRRRRRRRAWRWSSCASGAC